MLAVGPEARGRGAGRALIEECVRRAAAAGAERLGFARMPERDWSPAPGVHLIAYARPVP